MGQKQDFAFAAATSQVLPIALQNIDGTPFDLTNQSSIRFRACPYPSGDAVVQKDTTNGVGITGVPRTITMPNVSKLTWVANSSTTSLVFTAGAGTTATVLAGASALIYTDGSTNAVAIVNLASSSQSILATGLGSAAQQPAAAFLSGANNLSELTNTASARTNLGLGSAATQASSAFDAAGAAAAAQAGAISAAQASGLQKTANLSDVSSVSTARTNLGLGTAATQNTGYMVQSLSMGYGMTGNSDCFTILGWIATHAAYIVNTYGINAIGDEEQLINSSNGPGSAGTGWPITSDLSFGSMGGTITAWTNGSANFTIDISGIGWTPAVGDRLLFSSPNPASQTTTPIPGAFSTFTPYYLVSVSGSGSTRTIQLSATKGGSAIVNTDSKTNNILTWFAPDTPITSMGFANSIISYPTVIGRALYMAKSRGVTLDSSMETAIDGVIPAATTGNFGSNPIYCFGKVA